VSAALLVLLAAQDFEGLRWVDAPPAAAGKPRLVRWWTHGCELCLDSAPALGRLAAKADVVAVYHPKPPRDVEADQVRAWAKEIGMPGTLAIDRDWTLLDRWKPPKERAFTSLTFLFDARGRLAYVHPGGRITAGDEADLSRRIDALLK
jgi:thiol-disulfide isomerase/thioredoxin